MSGWQLSDDAPTSYRRFGHKSMEPWTEDLILAADCRDGDRVLDDACGTGLGASRVNLISRKLCMVTGVDLNEGMLNVARNNTQIAWKHGSALELPFDADSFDVVLCQQGLQYFPDRVKAMTEMARVLVPGGRLALNVWGALDRQPFHTAVITAVGIFLGSDARAAFDSAFSLHSAEELRQLAVSVGFSKVRVRYEHRTLRYPVTGRFVAGFMGATPVTARFIAMPDNRKQAFVAHVVEALATYVDDAGQAAPMEEWAGR
jgi:ubiquinone/menaquinone biosynthesis C-methylase UbiE